MIHTPLPYSFATNRGTVSKLKLHGIEADIHKASTPKKNLPQDTVLISNNTYGVTYRIQYDAHRYAEIYSGKPNQYHRGLTHISGCSPSMEQHIKFMESVKILHPTIVQLFSR